MVYSWKNVVVHIISHSHWDREWYLPFESHRMQLVELFDNLLICLRKWSWVQSFSLGWPNHCPWWLFGNPSREPWQVQRYIDEGQTQDWTILYLTGLTTWFPVKLTSAIPWLDKRNVPNGVNQLQIGYPDTFGNMGAGSSNPSKIRYSRSSLWSRCQANRIWQSVLEDEQFTSPIFWDVLARVLMVAVYWHSFANWYSNGNEIPVVKDEALVFWKQKVADVRDYASMANGWWWTAVTTSLFRNLSEEAIRVARTNSSLTLTLIHSSFDEYVQAGKCPSRTIINGHRWVN